MTQVEKKQRDPNIEFGFHAVIPRIVRTGYKDLQPTQKWLYVCLKDLCGEKGTCYRALRVLSLETGLSTGTLSEGIPELHKVGLIHAEKKRRSTGGKEVWHITIVDIWQANAKAHPTKRSPNEQTQEERSNSEQSQNVQNTNVQILNKPSQECSNSEQECSNSETEEESISRIIIEEGGENIEVVALATNLIIPPSFFTAMNEWNTTPHTPIPSYDFSEDIKALKSLGVFVKECSEPSQPHATSPSAPHEVKPQHVETPENQSVRIGLERDYGGADNARNPGGGKTSKRPSYSPGDSKQSETPAPDEESPKNKDKVMNDRVKAYYATFEALCREFFSDPEFKVKAIYAKKNPQYKEIVGLINDNASPEGMRLVFKDMFEEEDKNGGHFWQDPKKLTLDAFNRHYRPRIASIRFRAKQEQAKKEEEARKKELEAARELAAKSAQIGDAITPKIGPALTELQKRNRAMRQGA